MEIKYLQLWRGKRNKSHLIDVFVKMTSEQYDYFSQWKWGLSSEGYPCRYEHVKGKTISILMHREAAEKLGMEGAHIRHLSEGKLSIMPYNLKGGSVRDNLSDVHRERRAKMVGTKTTPEGKFIGQIRLNGKRIMSKTFDHRGEAYEWYWCCFDLIEKGGIDNELDLLKNIPSHWLNRNQIKKLRSNELKSQFILNFNSEENHVTF